jgi:hypothetical protein
MFTVQHLYRAGVSPLRSCSCLQVDAKMESVKNLLLGVLEKTKKRNAVVPAPRAGCLAEPGWRFCLGCEVGIISLVSLSRLRPDTATNKLAPAGTSRSSRQKRKTTHPMVTLFRAGEHYYEATHGCFAPYKRSYAARSHVRICQLAVVRDQKRKKMLSLASSFSPPRRLCRATRRQSEYREQ